MLKRQRRD